MNATGIGKALAMMALAVATAGCVWAGPVLYEPGLAFSSPVAPGRYTEIDANDNGRTSIVAIGRAANGMITVTPETPSERPDQAVFAPLEPGLWVTELFLKDSSYIIYGLARSAPDGSWTLTTFIECKPNQAIALAAGAILDPDDHTSDPACLFNSRAALEKGLRAYAAAQRPLPARLRWVPIGSR